MNPKNKINLSLFVSLLLTISFVSFLIYPFLKEIRNSSTEILSQRKNLASLEARAENLEEFKINYQAIKSDLEKLDKLLVDPRVPVEFITFLEATARNSKVTIKISPGPLTTIEKDPWPSLFFQITIFGSFPNFLRFLEKLENNLFLIEIQNLDINRLTEAELKLREFEKFSLGDVKANISLKIYTKPR